MPDDYDAQWRLILAGEHPVLHSARRLHRLLPSHPRCKLCNAPFRGFGGRVMKLFGRTPWPKSPTVCSGCQSFAESHPGGAEIELSFLFADVRGSTSIAERVSATELNALMNGFFATATDILFRESAWVDKFVGDEVVAFFVPGWLKGNHGETAVKVARELLEAVEAPRAAGEAVLPIGIGVHSGRAFVGTIGEGSATDLTALGDDVNIAARLASAAGAGEILVSEATLSVAGLSFAGTESRNLPLKGKSEPVAVRVLRAAPAATFRA